jgi:hypothetical protein
MRITISLNSRPLPTPTQGAPRAGAWPRASQALRSLDLSFVVTYLSHKAVPGAVPYDCGHEQSRLSGRFATSQAWRARVGGCLRCRRRAGGLRLAFMEAVARVAEFMEGLIPGRDVQGVAAEGTTSLGGIVVSLRSRVRPLLAIRILWLCIWLSYRQPLRKIGVAYTV